MPHANSSTQDNNASNWTYATLSEHILEIKCIQDKKKKVHNSSNNFSQVMKYNNKQVESSQKLLLYAGQFQS